MITPVNLSYQMVCTASRKAHEMGELFNSITQGAGNLAGFVGEEMILSLYPNASQMNTYDYDLALGSHTADVKTKRTTVTPLPHYECSVAAYNTRQEADMYIFCRVRKDYSLGWVLGFLPKDIYFENATYLTKGQVDPANNFTVKADCYNLPISELWDVTQLAEYL